MKKIVLLAVLLAGCTSAERAQIGAVGGSQHVVLYACDGHMISEWDSDGVVHTETGTDGWYFKDRISGKLVRVSGSVVITQN